MVVGSVAGGAGAVAGKAGWLVAGRTRTAAGDFRLIGRAVIMATSSMMTPIVLLLTMPRNRPLAAPMPMRSESGADRPTQRRSTNKAPPNVPAKAPMIVPTTGIGIRTDAA